MQIEFTPQIPNLIPPDKAKCTQNTCAGFLAQLSAPFPTTHNHIHCTSVSRCLRFRLKAIKKRDFILRSFQSALTSVGKADLRMLCHQYSNRLFLYTQPVCWSTRGVVHFVFWQPAVKQNPQTKLEKATQKAHFIPLFSSKTSNNKQSPLAFSVKQFLSLRWTILQLSEELHLYPSHL